MYIFVFLYFFAIIMHYSVFVLHSLFASETRVLGAHKASLKVLQGSQVLASKLFFLNCSIKKNNLGKMI